MSPQDAIARALMLLERNTYEAMQEARRTLSKAMAELAAKDSEEEAS